MPSKRFKKALEVVDAKKAYALKEAIGVLAKFPKAKFNETIDLAFRLGIDTASKRFAVNNCSNATRSPRFP